LSVCVRARVCVCVRVCACVRDMGSCVDTFCLDICTYICFFQNINIYEIPTLTISCVMPHYTYRSANKTSQNNIRVVFSSI